MCAPRNYFPVFGAGIYPEFGYAAKLLNGLFRTVQQSDARIPSNTRVPDFVRLKLSRIPGPVIYLKAPVDPRILQHLQKLVGHSNGRAESVRDRGLRKHLTQRLSR